MGQQGNRILLGGLILFVVGVFVGFGGAGLLDAGPAEETAREERTMTPPALDPTAGEGTDELASALQELRMTLASLQGVIERTANTPRETDARRTPVGEAGSLGNPQDLATSMNALAAALRAMPAARAPGTTGRGLIVPGYVDRQAAFDTDELKRIHRTDEDGERTEAATIAWRKEHLFLTQQDILDRYGKPDEVYRDDGFVEWCYLVRSPGEEEDIDFSFDEGIVVGAEYSYGWEE